MATDVGLQLLGLKLERFVAMNTDKISGNYFNEIFDEVISEHWRRRSNCLILIQFGQFSKIILGRKHLLKSIEDKIL